MKLTFEKAEWIWENGAPMPDEYAEFECVFGADAQKKRALVDETRRRVIAGPHPSPLSAYRGFFGSRPFSQVEAALGDWRWPEL